MKNENATAPTAVNYVTTMNRLFDLIGAPQLSDDDEKAREELQYLLDDKGIVLVDHPSMVDALKTDPDDVQECDVDVLSLKTAAVVPQLGPDHEFIAGNLMLVHIKHAKEFCKLLAETWTAANQETAKLWEERNGKPRYFLYCSVIRSIAKERELIQRDADRAKQMEANKKAAETQTADYYHHLFSLRGKPSLEGGVPAMDNQQWFLNRLGPEILERRLRQPLKADEAKCIGDKFDANWKQFKDYVFGELNTLNDGRDMPLKGREFFDAIKNAERSYSAGPKPIMDKTLGLRLEYPDNERDGRTRTFFATIPSEDQDKVRSVLEALVEEEIVVRFTINTVANLLLVAKWYDDLNAERQAERENVAQGNLRNKLLAAFAASETIDRSGKTKRRDNRYYAQK